MYKYQISPMSKKIIIKNEGNQIKSFLDPSPGNTDYQEYLEWVAKGNTAEEYIPEEV